MCRLPNHPSKHIQSIFETNKLHAEVMLVAIAIASGVLLVLRLVKPYVQRSPLDNIPGPPRTSFLFGNIAEFFGRHSWGFLEDVNTKYGPVVKTYAMFGAKSLYIFDPQAMHQVLVKEQDVFEEPPFFMVTRQITLGMGLLGAEGEHHRKQRKLLNPVFSIANMRNLTPIFYATMHRLRDGITKQLKTSDNAEVDMLNWMGRAALELIGQGGLGYSFDPLTENAPNDFGDAIKNLLPTATAAGLWGQTARLRDYIPSRKLQRFLVTLIPNKAVQELRKIIDTIDERSHDIYEAKLAALRAGEAALKEQVGEGKDIMSVLLRANLEASEEDCLPEEEVIAQMSTFIFAGTDTTSNGLARILQLLADHQEVQEKLRAEICEARNGQDISYDDLMELPYLDAVCRETLRLHSPVSVVFREAIRDTVLQLSEPVRGIKGTHTHDIPIAKGTQVLIGIQGSNRHKALWGDDADEWKPERWLEKLPDTITNARIPGIYSHLMTFSGGGRSCIGFKFSQLEMKVVLSILLETFKFSPSGKDIAWNRAGVNYPTVGRDDPTPSMPLRVEFVKS